MLPSPGATSGRRAPPLPPHVRRAALIAATLPLIRRRGLDVSTRQIADAAGVAEGTIFRAFRDKESLIRAAIEAAFDPAPVLAALERTDLPSLPLEQRLVEIVRIVQDWLASVIDLMMALRGSPPPGGKPRLGRRRPSRIIRAAIARLIGPDRAELRMAPEQVARLLHLMIFSGSHRAITGGRLLAPEEIVGVILDGVRVHGTGARARRARRSAPQTTGEDSC